MRLDDLKIRYQISTIKDPKARIEALLELEKTEKEKNHDGIHGRWPEMVLYDISSGCKMLEEPPWRQRGALRQGMEGKRSSLSNGSSVQRERRNVLVS